MQIMALTRHRGEGATGPVAVREAFVAQPMERRIPIRRHFCCIVYSGDLGMDQNGGGGSESAFP